MYDIQFKKCPVSGTNMDTDIYVIKATVAGWGLSAIVLSREGDVARISVGKGGEHPFACVVVYHLREKTIEFEGETVSYVKAMLCVL